MVSPQLHGYLYTATGTWQHIVCGHVVSCTTCVTRLYMTCMYVCMINRMYMYVYIYTCTCSIHLYHTTLFVLQFLHPAVYRHTHFILFPLTTTMPLLQVGCPLLSTTSFSPPVQTKAHDPSVSSIKSHHMMTICRKQNASNPWKKGGNHAGMFGIGSRSCNHTTRL